MKAEALAIAGALRATTGEVPVQIYAPSKILPIATDTRGWVARIGKIKNRPLWEDYKKRRRYYGFYDLFSLERTKARKSFRKHAVVFLLDAIHLCGATKPDVEATREVYPRFENRRLVKAHLQRERSSYLSAECKRRDKYECRVCGFKFATMYGLELGAGFAESHHVKHLQYAADRVRTKLEDLITVCANCHRMLHRMEGAHDDAKKLRKRLRRAQKKEPGERE